MAIHHSPLSFPSHRCDDCGINAVEDNDFVSGIDHVEGRAPLEVAWS